MISVVPYEPKHLALLQVREEQKADVPKEIGGDAVTILNDEIPVAILGGYQIVPGVLQAWSLISDYVKKIPIAFHREVKNFIGFIMKKYAIRRIQMSVVVGFQIGWRWASALGFKPEGIMKQYGIDGRDYWLFAKVNHVVG